MASVVSLKGWVPMRLAWKDGQAFVDWCRLGTERFTEPFFDDTIDRAQHRPFNALFTHRTPIAELEAWHAVSPGLAPSGFIFHMSRCGSTLVSRMLAALEENLVISEASPIDRIARAAWIPETMRAVWLLAMVSALGQKRSGRETRYFIKFDSPTVMALPFIRRVFPSVPWIFMYRRPEEVLVSLMREPAAAMTPGIITDAAVLDAPGSEVLSMTPEEYAARVVGRLCEYAAAVLDDGGLPVNYTQLPEAVWEDIARHFGAALSPGDVERMRGVVGYDAKRPRRRFAPDGESKQREATDSVREAADRWIYPYYRELERMRERSMTSCTASPSIRKNPSLR